MTTSGDLEALRSSLRRQASELGELLKLREADGRPVELDQAVQGRLSRMDALQQQAMSHATSRRAQLELVRIEATLLRIERGTYGLCVRCKEPLPSERLTADPCATLCADCRDEQAEYLALRPGR